MHCSHTNVVEWAGQEVPLLVSLQQEGFTKIIISVPHPKLETLPAQTHLKVHGLTSFIN